MWNELIGRPFPFPFPFEVEAVFESVAQATRFRFVDRRNRNFKLRSMNWPFSVGFARCDRVILIKRPAEPRRGESSHFLQHIECDTIARDCLRARAWCVWRARNVEKEKCVNWVIISIWSIFVSPSVARSRARVSAPSILTFCLARKNLPFSDRRQPSTTRLCGARDLISVAMPCQMHHDQRLQFAVSCKVKLGRRTQQVCPFCCCCHCCQARWAARTHMRSPSKSNSGSFSRRRVTNAPMREPHFTDYAKHLAKPSDARPFLLIREIIIGTWTAAQLKISIA